MIIIDDVIDKELQDEIERSIFGKETKWTFSRSVFYDKHPEVTEIQKKSLMSFTKQLIDPNGLKEPDYNLYANILSGIESKTNIKIKSVFNARIQLQLPLLTEKDKIYGIPHVDARVATNYYVVVYYVNDVDGDTVLFKQTINNATPQDIIDCKLDIDKTVSPKKGRAVIFDGDIYHSVGKPKTDMRCIVNFNFKV